MTLDPFMTDSHEPLTETEYTIASIWKEALATPELPCATDNFFVLGGDSIAMVMVELRIQDEFSTELPQGAMLQRPTLRELARFVEHSIGAPPSTSSRPDPKATGRNPTSTDH